jgi:hypothetical protein
MVTVMNQLSISSLASGGVITNYHCVSKCGHCLYNCSPDRSKAYLNRPTAEKIFSRILDLGCRSVHIGGGEPLLKPKKLLDVADAARQAGVGIDYVETNSAWFTNGDQAAAVLTDLRNAGVGTLLVSISPFHNAFIPYDRVMGVIDACRRVGMTVFPWVNAFVRDLTRLDIYRTHDMTEFEAAFGSDYLQRIPDRYWIHLGGRAFKTFGSVYAGRSLEQVLAESPSTCARALSDTRHFHIDLHGHYIPGLCAGLVIEMEDLGNGLPAGKYGLLEKLVTGGIRGLFAVARERYAYPSRSEGYLNHCDLCNDIRSFLCRLEGRKFAELAPDGFYT